jgi:hypothetical protein
MIWTCTPPPSRSPDTGAAARRGGRGLPAGCSRYRRPRQRPRWWRVVANHRLRRPTPPGPPAAGEISCGPEHCRGHLLRPRCTHRRQRYTSPGGLVLVIVSWSAKTRWCRVIGHDSATIMRDRRQSHRHRIGRTRRTTTHRPGKSPTTRRGRIQSAGAHLSTRGRPMPLATVVHACSRESIRAVIALATPERRGADSRRRTRQERCGAKYPGLV